jgi:hypothetical protein
VIFLHIISTLQKELKSNFAQIRFLLKKNPGLAFSTINEIATKVGQTYGIRLTLNFPERYKIMDFESYGTENLGFVFQRNSKSFTISRDLIKRKALEILDSVDVQDAYMYEGKEGVRIIGSEYRLDILPASLHVWGKIDEKISRFCNWLLVNCYEVRPGVEGAFKDTNS